MHFLRVAEPSDGQAISEMYTHYVHNTIVTFDEVAPSGPSFSEKISKSAHPWIVAVEEATGRVVGWAYSGPHSDRAAYRWTCYVGLYLHPDLSSKRTGLGSRLYSSLIRVLEAMNHRRLLAGIAVPNEPSFALHRKFGFDRDCLYPKLGFKMGRWIDVIWLQKDINSTEGIPEEPLDWSQVKSQKWVEELLLK
jgi:L-amino acid N-acyltransferase YncA